MSNVDIICVYLFLFFNAELYSTATSIYKVVGNSEYPEQFVERGFIGSRVVITFTSALIDLAVEGEDGIYLSHVESNPITGTNWSVRIGGRREIITWEFYGACGL